MTNRIKDECNAITSHEGKDCKPIRPEDHNINENNSSLEALINRVCVYICIYTFI
jgi:hypothetical protein